ncbi:MAG: major capsid protein [Chromatiales bacterium]|nr:major capsid protein [Chromatiales bacterium]
MAFSPFDLATLQEVQRQQITLPIFWLAFFGRTINFDTPYIDFETVDRRYKKLAPFVAPTAQGRIIKTQGSSMKRFSPAYVKPKSVVDPAKVFSRQPGEFIYRQMSAGERRLAVIAEELKEQKQRIQNRLEWMAAQAVIMGSVTVAGEDYPTQVVDFQRDASLTVVLAGGAKWDQATGDPLGDLLDSRRNVNKLAGVTVRRVVFGAGAWDLLATRLELNNPANGNLLDTNFRGSTTDVSRILEGFEGAEYVGTLAGRNGQGAIECWVYSATYDDDSDAEQAMMHTNDVVGVGPIDGVRCFGAIQDAQAGYLPLETFTKNWFSDDPSVEWLMSQSAPLMVPAEPNASFRIRVA